MTEALLSIWLFSAIGMFLLYLVWCRNRFSALVDVGWAFMVFGSILYLGWTGEGQYERRALATAIGGLWSLRVAVFLLKDRVLKAKHDDGRYVYMVKWAGNNASLAMLIFYQMQAIFVVLFAVPVAAVMFSNVPTVGILDLLGVAIGVLAIVGESLSDRQLTAFRAEPSNAGTTCRSGLWARSRHPNYFFEWLFWFTFVCMAWGGNTFPVALAGPVIVYLFLMKVTGIPHTERQAASHRSDYADYQKDVPMFFPRMFSARPVEGGPTKEGMKE